MSKEKLVFGERKQESFTGLLHSSMEEAGQYDSLAPASANGRREENEQKWTNIGRAPPITVDNDSTEDSKQKSQLLEDFSPNANGPNSFDLASDMSFRNDFLRKTPTDFKYGVLPSLFFGNETSGWHNSQSIYRVCIILVFIASILSMFGYASYSWLSMFYFDENFLHPIQLLFFRYLTQFITCLIFAYFKYQIREELPNCLICIQNDWLNVESNNRLRIVTQRILYVIASTSFFYSLRFLTLAESMVFVTSLNSVIKPLFDLAKFLRNRGSDVLIKVRQFYNYHFKNDEDMDLFVRTNSNVIMSSTLSFWCLSMILFVSLWMIIRMPFYPLFSGMGLTQNDSIHYLKQHNHTQLDGRSKKKYWVGTSYLACLICSLCLCLAFSLLKSDPSNESVSVNLKKEHALNARRRIEFPLYMDLLIDAVFGLLLTVTYFCVEPNHWKSVTASNISSDKDAMIALKWLLIILILPLTMTISQVLMGFASAQVESGMVSLIRSSDIIVGLLITLGIFGIHQSWPSIGASLICWIVCLALSLKLLRIVQLQMMLSPQYAQIGQRQAVLDDTRSQLL